MADVVQAPANLLESYRVDEIQVGELSIRGDELRSIEVPVKGLPAWRIAFDRGEGEEVMFATNVPIIFTGKKIIVPHEETEDEPSADE